jgi:thioredoxin-related protein
MKKRWKQASVLLALLVLLLAGGVDTAVSARAADGGIQWLSYAEGRQRGEDESKKVFLVFNADWCRYCLKMEKETFQDPSVVAYVNRNFVPISVNSDREQAIAEKFNVRGLPSTWFISENGDRIGSRPGFIPADEMLQILKFIGSDSYRSMNFQTFLDKKK